MTGVAAMTVIWRTQFNSACRIRTEYGNPITVERPGVGRAAGDRDASYCSAAGHRWPGRRCEIIAITNDYEDNSAMPKRPLVARWSILLAAPAALLAAAADDSLPDPLDAGWNGEPVCENLEEDARHRLLRCVFPPGVGHERHYHAPHTGYVLRGGRMRLTDPDGERVVDVPAGATWTSDGIEWHEALNVGDKTSSYLIIEIKGR